jgi:atypical dual specificity phosphatase
MSKWWIDEPLVMGSSNPSEADLLDLRSLGFGILVCLLDPKEQAPSYREEYATELGYRLHAIAIRDYQPPSLAQLGQFVTVAQGASERERLLVHCQGGTGRTGTMAAAYWIAKGLSKSAAVARVRQARPGAVETPEQHQRLEEFERVWKNR